MNRARPGGADITSTAGCPAAGSPQEWLLVWKRGAGRGVTHELPSRVDSLTANPAAPGVGRGAAAGRAQKCPDEVPATLDKPRCGLAASVSPGCGRPDHLPALGCGEAIRPPRRSQLAPRPSPPCNYRPVPWLPRPGKRTGQSDTSYLLPGTHEWTQPRPPAHLVQSLPQTGSPSPTIVHTNLQPLAPQV